MRRLLFLFASLVSASSLATPYVTNVVARQRLPWNGLVDVSYEIVGTTNTLECVYGLLTATDRTRGKTYVASSFEKKIDLSEGKHTSVWNMAADTSFTSKDVVFNLSIREPALYCVIDLSGGPNATSYPVSELDDVPTGGWTDEYKTTRLVLRCINPGTCIVGEDLADETHRVWITKRFYLGIFEVTQKQYSLVMNANPGRISIGDAFPVNGVMYSQIRGLPWPSADIASEDSFLGKLSLKTGLKFDLPSRVQWEYACRAGSNSIFYWGDSFDGDYCWCFENSGLSPHEVATKLPNQWGLFDMLGNLEEWCVDWGGPYIKTFGVDPYQDCRSSNSNKGDDHGLVGGCYHLQAPSTGEGSGCWYWAIGDSGDEHFYGMAEQYGFRAMLKSVTD